jgi:cytochrome c peroxidase
MHDGSLGTLEDVIEYYDRGGNRNPGLYGEIHPLHLSAAEKQSLLSFLRSLAR